jgi:hypothetical protein
MAAIRSAAVQIVRPPSSAGPGGPGAAVFIPSATPVSVVRDSPISAEKKRGEVVDRTPLVIIADLSVRQMLHRGYAGMY